MKLETLAPRIDQSKSQALLAAAIGGGFGEIFFEESRSESLLFDQGRLRSNNSASQRGLGVRRVLGSETHYSHVEALDQTALEDAVSALGKSQAGASTNGRYHTKPHQLYHPYTTPELSLRLDLIQKIDETIRALDPRIINVTIAMISAEQQIAILPPEGEALADQRPMSRINISVTVDENGRRETGSAGKGGRYDLQKLMAENVWLALGKEALRIALVNIEARPCPAGELNLLLGPGWPGVLIHEAVGHGLEGDANRRGTSAFAELMGKKVAAKGVRVVDDGTINARRGSINFDDEGHETNHNVLIEDGVLVGYMQDRLNAELMGAKSTGNCRRESYAHAPMPRMTNTYLDNGNDDPVDLLANMGDGIYATGFGGGQVDTTSGKFVFNCTEAYLVEGGKVQHPVKGATLIGDGPTALTKIIGVGNDLSLDPGVGNCGKAGQWVPVSVGQPSVLMQGITIGGTEIG